MNIVFFGPPGAGKGTQAHRLEDNYNLKHLSSGEILREVISTGGNLGQEIKDLLDKGQLAPDEIIIKMVSERIRHHDCSQGVIFDGFPRTVTQARALDDILADCNSRVDIAIELEVDEAQMIERIRSRIRESGDDVRHDDNEQTLKNRLAVYRRQTAPVLPYYVDKGLLHRIDGMQSIEDVTNDIKRVIRENVTG